MRGSEAKSRCCLPLFAAAIALALAGAPASAQDLVKLGVANLSFPSHAGLIIPRYFKEPVRDQSVIHVP